MMRDCSGRVHPGQSTCRGRLLWGHPTTWRPRSWCNLRRATISQQVSRHSQLHSTMSQCRRPNTISLPSGSCKAGHAGCTDACSTGACFWHSEGIFSLVASPACSRVHASCRHLVLWDGAAGAGEGQSAPGGLLLYKDHPGHCAWRCAQPADVWLHTQILKSERSAPNSYDDQSSTRSRCTAALHRLVSEQLYRCKSLFRPCLSLTIYPSPQGLDSMVAACLNKDANQRPTAAELLKDPVLKHGHDHKWLAKRLAALERDRSSRRVSFKDGSSTAHSGSQSPNHTPPVSFCSSWSRPVSPKTPITSYYIASHACLKMLGQLGQQHPQPQPGACTCHRPAGIPLWPATSSAKLHYALTRKPIHGHFSCAVCS